MKKKWISITIISLILLSISISKTLLEASYAIETSTRVHTQLGDDTFEVKDIPYITERIEAAYPEIISGADQDKLDKWNQIIKDDFDKILAIYSYDPFSELKETPTESNRIILNINYEIKLLNAQFLSVFYRAFYSSPYSAHPSELVYTTNIDTVRDRRVILSDLVNLNDDFVSFLRSWDFSTVEPSNPMLNAVIKSILNDMSDDELLNGLKSADQIGSNNRWGIYTYLTPNKLGVSVSVPHFAGDHVELEKEYEELKDYLNPDFHWDFNQN